MLDFLKARFRFLLVRWFYCLVRVDNGVTQWTMTAHIYREIEGPRDLQHNTS